MTDKINTIKSALITCPHGFSTRTGGVSCGIFESLNLGMNLGDDPAKVTENWKRFLDSARITQRDFVCGEQVHGDFVYTADSADLRPACGSGELIAADGYVTNKAGVPLAIFVADCLPVLLQDPAAGAIGALHCGWRSTVLDIQRNAILAMEALGSRPSDIRAALGPAIDKCCFEVGAEVIFEVEKLLGKSEAGRFCEERKVTKESLGNSSQNLPSADISPMPQKYLLDLRGVVRERFLQLGLRPENIDTVGECTMCNPEKYWSHRYTAGARGSQAAVIATK